MPTGRENIRVHDPSCASLTSLSSCLAHRIRLEILRTLAESSKDVSTVAEELQLGIDTISHHLRLLRKCGFVQVEAIKQKRIYSLARRVITSVSGKILNITVDGSNEEGITIHIAPSPRFAETARSPITGQSIREPSSG